MFDRHAIVTLFLLLLNEPSHTTQENRSSSSPCPVRVDTRKCGTLPKAQAKRSPAHLGTHDDSLPTGHTTSTSVPTRTSRGGASLSNNFLKSLLDLNKMHNVREGRHYVYHCGKSVKVADLGRPRALASKVHGILCAPDPRRCSTAPLKEVTANRAA